MDPVRPRRRRRRWLIPLALLGLLMILFVALRTPDTDRAAMLAKYGQTPSAFADGGGMRVHYRDQGRRDAPAIILLHGSNASLHTWEPLVARLGGDWRVITLDLPGHGLTGTTRDGRYDAAVMMRAVDLVAGRTGIDHFILGGNSMGGWVAWRYAIESPRRVRALLLLNAAGMPPRVGDPPPPSNIGFRIMRYPVGRWLGERITPRFLVAQSLRGSVANPALVDDAMIDRYWELLRFPGNRAATVTRATTARQPEMADRIGSITVPTLILFGREDRIILPSAATTFAERISGSETVLLDGVGHLPMEEAPDATAATIERFLARRL